MPELPEVETIRKTLIGLVAGKKIIDVHIFWPKIIQHPEVDEFSVLIKGQTIQDIKRRGKFLIFLLDDFSLVSHLRMEGKYALYPNHEPIDKHTHVIFQLENNEQLRYRDVRKFGTMHLFPKGKEMDELPLNKLGPEPFSEEFTVQYLTKKLNKTSRSIKSALLDQTIVAGLGNIYVDEVLFRSHVHPEKLANQLKRFEVKRIHEEIIQTLNEAVEKGGSTVRTYINSQGEIGMFQLDLYVYGRTGEHCKVCGAPLERLVVGGRGTHICPKCQKKK